MWELSSRPLPAPDSFWCETGAVRAPSLYEIIVRSRGLYSLSLNRNWLIGLRRPAFPKRLLGRSRGRDVLHGASLRKMNAYGMVTYGSAKRPFDKLPTRVKRRERRLNAVC